MRRIAIALTLVVSLGAPAFAGTDAETFNKLIAKVVAPKNKFKPRVACVCVPGGEAGYILQVPALDTPIYCVTPTFNPDGSLEGASSCPDGDYRVLGR